jgi:aerobic-type carbon monoxide dehydrogenase small subunit (CoxS/CutS family)
MKLVVNGKPFEVAVPPETPLLWALREEVGLTGTKYGCGIAQCGACTVHVDGKPKRSCVTSCGDVGELPITTIEGLAGRAEGLATEAALHPVQRAWIEENVPQCGYCQAGQIMTTVMLLEAKPQPTDEDIDAALSANLCRCGTYPRIRKAVHRAAEMLARPIADGDK